jgi:hypothetical protein
VYNFTITNLEKDYYFEDHIERGENQFTFGVECLSEDKNECENVIVEKIRMIE